MALAMSLRSAARAVRVPSGVAVRLAHSFKERERAAEAAYFNKEEEKLLRRILSKVKTQSESSDKAGTAAAVSVERQRLEAIVGKYGLSDADKDALITWRHSHDF